jgi:hypothetical protein
LSWSFIYLLITGLSFIYCVQRKQGKGGSLEHGGKSHCRIIPRGEEVEMQKGSAGGSHEEGQSSV